MIRLNDFVHKVYDLVSEIFENFHNETYIKMTQNIESLKKYVDTHSVNNILDPGSECDYIPYRTINAAMRKEVLEKILEISYDFADGNTGDKDKKRILSQHLWMLVDGWDEEPTIRLVMTRLGMESTITYRHKKK